jgi:hypothetical protein
MHKNYLNRNRLEMSEYGSVITHKVRIKYLSVSFEGNTHTECY